MQLYHCLLIKEMSHIDHHLALQHKREIVTGHILRLGCLKQVQGSASSETNASDQSSGGYNHLSCILFFKIYFVLSFCLNAELKGYDCTYIPLDRSVTCLRAMLKVS